LLRALGQLGKVGGELVGAGLFGFPAFPLAMILPMRDSFAGAVRIEVIAVILARCVRSRVGCFRGRLCVYGWPVRALAISGLLRAGPSGFCP
jgi:hypothetical protein